MARDGADGLCAAVLERLGHGRLVHGLEAAVQREVCDLEHLLHEGVWRALEHCLDMGRAVVGEVKINKLVLRDQVRDARLGKVQRRLQEIVSAPFQFTRDGDQVGGVSRRGQRRRRWFSIVVAKDVDDVLGDTACEAQDRVCVDVCGEPQHSVAVHTGVFEVDARLTVLGHDQL